MSAAGRVPPSPRSALLCIGGGGLVGAVSIVLLALASPALAQLRGHGGPVRAVAVSPDGRLALSGSFDQSAILWSLDQGTALAVLRFHDGAVNAAAALADGRFATGGEDGRIALWRAGEAAPVRVIEPHKGPIVALAVSPDGSAIASDSWDGTARASPLVGDGPARVLNGHQGNVNGVAFAPGGRLVTAGYDATLRIFPPDEGAPAIVTLPTPLNAVAVAPDGEIVAGGADGGLRILTADGKPRAEVEIGPTPIIALALSPDGGRIAAATIGGVVARLPARRRRTPDRRQRPRRAPLGHETRRADRPRRDGAPRRFPRRLQGRPRRRAVPGLRRLPHADAGWPQPRRADAARRLRPPHRDRAGLQFLDAAQGPGHRLERRDDPEALRDRAVALHARHQDAGADNWRPGRPSRPRSLPRTGLEEPLRLFVTGSVRFVPNGPASPTSHQEGAARGRAEVRARSWRRRAGRGGAGAAIRQAAEARTIAFDLFRHAALRAT